MDATEIKRLASLVVAGELEPAELEARLRDGATAELGYACVDTDRARRTGVAEVIYGAGKTPEQIAGIMRAMRDAGQERVLVTRFDAQKAARVTELLGPDFAMGAACEAAAVDGSCERDAMAHEQGFVYHPEAQLGIAGGLPQATGAGEILVMCAGTSDLAVAEEAALTAEFLGNRVRRVFDVGVAGIHRLLAHSEDIHRARVIVAVAGMEGALPSVVAGLASCPVLAVPTSVGYGASFGGVTALLAMLNSCASGVSVVNIDNGFGAAFQASLINHL